MARWFNLVVDQGSTFTNDFALLDSAGDPLDVTNFTANAAMKPHYTYGNTVSFDTTLSNGQVTVALTANATANLAEGRYVYDVKVTDAQGVVVRVVQGQVTVQPKVT